MYGTLSSSPDESNARHGHVATVHYGWCTGGVRSHSDRQKMPAVAYGKAVRDA